ncbi:MAG: Uma2 family endonuclease [Chloroflexota bacterium]|nr:Uma2 family endonuclease [Chloroflexota bacterium]
MSVALRTYTYADLAEMPDDGNRYEVIGGELIVAPAPTTNHQLVVTALTSLLWHHAVGQGLGQVFTAPTDVVLSPYNVVEPDIVFVSAARARMVSAAAITGPPDLVIEVLSPRTRGYDLVRKKAMYATAGVPEYWIADPDRRTLLVYTLVDGEYDEVETTGGIIRSLVVPGFELTIADGFAGLKPEAEH